MSQKIVSKRETPEGMVTSLEIAIGAIKEGKFFCAKTFVEDVFHNLHNECMRNGEERNSLK